MKSGIWKVEVARLCWACQQEMAHEYIMQPTKEQRRDPVRDRWESGVCERCGRKQSNRETAETAEEHGRWQGADGTTISGGEEA